VNREAEDGRGMAEEITDLFAPLGLAEYATVPNRI
jgi:hypothetical protein